MEICNQSGDLFPKSSAKTNTSGIASMAFKHTRGVAQPKNFMKFARINANQLVALALTLLYCIFPNSLYCLYRA